MVQRGFIPIPTWTESAGKAKRVGGPGNTAPERSRQAYLDGVGGEGKAGLQRPEDDHRVLGGAQVGHHEVQRGSAGQHAQLGEGEARGRGLGV